ncbi:MAG: B12-binding domain-containing radical SAM protein [Actinobacteria bacterium]|nr:B12-binding domain-containing radical SAM protein [Actinomycetota bacterium]MBU1942227.1 B12-binding domain-containing radical SAM protein [Actinomycetota bacterium]MBU2687424.1 B12-binding domain-containing radical SAM protein [Actinomycetota bacterium]
MARVLLIYPRMKVLAPRFPYSVLPIAAALLEGGHEVHVLDTQVEELDSVDPRGFDLVGVSTYSGSQIEGALQAAARVRSLAPGVRLVWGGVHPTMTPEQTARHPLVDVVVRGEGEATLAAMIAALESGGDLEEIPGLTYLEGGHLVKTPDSGYIDLDALPMLPYHLIKPERYVHFHEKPTRVYFESSRGCPHNCGFCYNEVMHHRRWRAKSVGRVLDEMEYILAELGPDEIWPSDDNFAVDGGRVAEIARGKIERGMTFNWVLSSRFDYALKYDRDFLELLKESGCATISFGGESGSPRILDMICKGITPEKMMETTGNLRDNGVVCGVNFMAGFPSETRAELFQTFDLIDDLLEIEPDLAAGISIYTPFPGTPLYDRALEHGFREPGSLEGWGAYRYGIVNNLPWLDRRRRNIIRVVGLISSFDFTARRYRPRGVLHGRRIVSLAYRVLNASARFRWRKRFFNPAPEWWLLDAFLRYMRFWER